MPEDKWGHPYFYATKKSAGLSEKGTGFFWQQNNDIRKDEDAGMLRLGKESEAVNVINTSTGEWEFPFTFAYSYSDGFSMSGPTGHHSGGETHGCQGYTYMIHIENMDQSSPQFRFRKETYHVQYDNDPKSGVWTSSAATGAVANNWKGLGWVRYNKKDGRSSGKDSVILECWWNEDPSNVKNWKMIKRIEDKGAGFNNWGVKATCDGDDYQVGTWSNIQFRFKSSGADFSLHPLQPETNNGPNINSIGEEDMSFSDCEDRGYGYRKDMPRDIEMKCLFKWNGGGKGKCRFKNISLREIDPSLSFDDVPDNPEPSEQPTGTTTVQGFFKFQQDINDYRTQSDCAGTTPEGGGTGGSGGKTKFYSVSEDEDKELSNTSTWDNRTRITMKASNSSSDFYHKVIKQINIPLKKNGSPSGININMKIWSSSGSVIYTSPTVTDINTLSTSFVDKTFDFSTNTHSMATGERVGVEYTGNSSSNYLVASYQGTSYPNTTYEQYEGGSWESKSRRLAMYVYE